jgi:FKBP-type peptidyl-prolyl cis-trans isomerase
VLVVVSLLGCSKGDGAGPADGSSADGSRDGGTSGSPAASVSAELAAATPPQMTPPPADVAAPPPGAQMSSSGVAYRTLRAGSGQTRAGRGDAVRVALEAWSRDGHPVSWTEMNDDAVIQMGQVKPGLYDLLGTMVEGEIREAWVPLAALEGHGFTQDLTLLVSLKKVLRGPDVPQENIEAAPHGAKRTPAAKLVESSRFMDKTDLKYDVLSPAWRSLLATIPVGGKARFWVPSVAAYEAAPPLGTPTTLVVDLEVHAVR